MRKAVISLRDNSYNIFIGEGLLESTGELLQRVLPGKKVMLVSDPNVYSFYGKRCKSSLEKCGFLVAEALIAGGEQCKNLEEAKKLYGAALDAGLDRKSTLLALGGGVTGDLTGFVAATFLRGIGYVQLPTTLLAQVDSSVGGKVAVNLPRGKNLVGAFFHPLAVITDTGTLMTLSSRQLLSGAAEVLKYGVIWDESFFQYLDNNIDHLIKDPLALAPSIARSVEIKGEIVAQDEREKDLRRVLNFGHTFGHALEAATHYESYLHGEAVLAGMVIATKVAEKSKICPPEEAERILNLLQKLGPPPLPVELNEDYFWSAFYRDKKREGEQVVLVLPEKVGKVGMFSGYSLEIVRESFLWYKDSFTS